MPEGAANPREPTPPDWGAIRTDYVQGDLSLAKLSEKYSIPKSTLGDKSKGEGWVEQRKKYLELVQLKADEAAAKKKVKKLTAGREIATTNATVILMALRKKLGLKDGGKIKLSSGGEIEIPDLEALELRRLALANTGAFNSLCVALGVEPIESGDSLVELPDDPLADLEEGLEDEEGDGSS